MELGTLTIIDRNGYEAETIMPILAAAPDAYNFEHELFAFLGKRLLNGRNMVIYAPANPIAWFDKLVEVRNGERAVANLLLDAKLDGLIGGINIQAAYDEDIHAFRYQFSTHT